MCNDALNWAWKINVDNLPSKLVLVSLADRADEDTFQCWPRIADTAQRCGMSVRTVYRALEYLEENGLLIRNERRWPHGGSRSSLYTLPVTLTGGAVTTDREGLPLLADQEPSIEPTDRKKVPAPSGANEPRIDLGQEQKRQHSRQPLARDISRDGRNKGDVPPLISPGGLTPTVQVNGGFRTISTEEAMTEKISDPHDRRYPDTPTDEPPKARLFREGKTILVALGISEGRSGAVIGRWLKHNPDAVGILAALEYAYKNNVIEPVAYVTKLLNTGGKTNGNREEPAAERAYKLAEQARVLERQAGFGRQDDSVRRH